MITSKIRTAAVRLWRSPVSIVVYFAGLVLLAFVLGSSPRDHHAAELGGGAGDGSLEPGEIADAFPIRDFRAAVADGPVPSVGLYWLKSSDPTGGTGMAAPLDQLLIRTDDPSLYYKSGSSNFAWTRIGTGTGGGGGGTVSSIGCGTGLACSPSSPITTTGTITLNITPTTCPAGQAEIATASDGTSICAAFAPGSAVSGTTNRLSKFTSASAVGNSTASDDGTTFAVNTTALTVTEASGNTTVGGTLQTGGALNMTTHLINNVADPASAQDAATKNYVDNSTTGSVTGTVNFVAKFSGAHAVGNSLITDDGTTFAVNTSKFTITEASGNTVIAGTLQINGALDMATHRINNVVDPIALSDAATKNYVDTAVNGAAGTVPKFTAAHVIGNSSITEDGTTFAISTTSFTVTEASGNTSIAGTCSIGGALNMNSHLIDNVTDPSSAQDAATKHYVDGSTTGAVSGTLNTIPKFTSANVIGNSSATDDGTTFKINSTEFQVTEASGNVTYLGTMTGGSSGQFTVSATGLLSTPKVTGSGSAGNSSVVGSFTQTAQTASVGAFSGTNTGTYNATAATRTSFGISVSDTATRSAGANNLTNIGVDTSASGGQVNWAARFNGGDVNLAAGHMIATGTAPALTSCGSGASITGSDYAATFTTGTGGTSCTYTFAATFGAAPTCVISVENSTTHPTYTISATAITFTVTQASTSYDVICVGHQ